jgi:hypothetical protein
MLIVDHYMKKLSRTGDVVLQRTDKVKLRNFSAKDKAIVDTEGMILTTSRPAFGRTAAGRRASRRWRPPHPLGRYFGAVISVFDGTDQLIYQTVTKKELLSGARQEASE